MRFVLPHPKDRRLRCEYGEEGHGLFVELWLRGHVGPAVRLPDLGEGFVWADWDPQRTPFWQAIELLTGPWFHFVSVVDVAEAIDILEGEVAADESPDRLKRVVELVRNLRVSCGVGR